MAILNDINTLLKEFVNQSQVQILIDSKVEFFIPTKENIKLYIMNNANKILISQS